MRIRRVFRFWPALVVVPAALVVYAVWPARYTYTVSPETTYITEPLDAGGFVDYQAAVNDQLAKGVTPENNANVLIFQALGPHPEGGTMPPEYFRRLGVPQPPEAGEYFIGWDKYFQAHLKDPPDDVLDLVGDEREWKEQWTARSDRARQWPWRAKDEPEFAAWLKVNEKPLALMAEAGRRPKYYNPLVSTSTDPQSARLISALLPSVQKCREVGSALVCRAMGRIGEGDYAAAWQDLLACQRLGRVLAGGGTLIEDLVGIAIVNIATNAQVTFLGHGAHSSAQLRAWLADLRALPPMPPLADKMALSERLMTLDALMSIAYHGPGVLDQLAGSAGPKPVKNEFWGRMMGRSIDFDPAFRKVNAMFDRCEAACRLPVRAARKAAFTEIEDDIKERKAGVVALGPVERATMGRAKRGEYVGDVLIGLMLPAFTKIQDAADRTEQAQANLQLAFALAAHRADSGRYPARLDEVAPRYLPQVPGDLFSGKPLVYRPADGGYLLYSVGLNGVDEGGRWTDDDPRGDDLRVRMPVPPPVEKRADPLTGRDRP
jgi:hypothetical protein